MDEAEGRSYSFPSSRRFTSLPEQQVRNPPQVVRGVTDGDLGGATARAARRLERAQERLSRFQQSGVSTSSPEHDITIVNLATKGEDDDDTKGLCAICMSQPRSVRLRPCSHAISCTMCTLRLLDASSHCLKCPICKLAAMTVEWTRPAQCSDRPSARLWALPKGQGVTGGPPATALPTRPCLRRLVTFDEIPTGDRCVSALQLECDPAPLSHPVPLIIAQSEHR